MFVSKTRCWPTSHSRSYIVELEIGGKWKSEEESLSLGPTQVRHSVTKMWLLGLSILVGGSKFQQLAPHPGKVLEGKEETSYILEAI